MKLQLAPASQGLQWVKLGIRTFFKQPLALAGLFFLFMATLTVLSMVPLVGNVLSLLVLPALTVGLMRATQLANEGSFPMPLVLFHAFQVDRPALHAILKLGGMYAASFLLVMGVSAMVDGGAFAKLYLVGGEITPATLQNSNFSLAALVALALYIPLSMMFWHAPALVHWHQVSPTKSIFFSFMACKRNFGAFTVYSVVWMGALLAMLFMVASIAVLLGTVQMLMAALVPSSMLLAAMFFTSIYFTFRDCFDVSSGATP